MRRFRALLFAALAPLLAVTALVLPSEPPPAVAATRGWIDTSNRSAVATAYLNTFNAPVPDPAWNGNVASCQAGTISAGHRAAMMNRVNWYRAMAGVLDGVVEDPTFTTDAQNAALIMSANNFLSHDPAPGNLCYSTSGDKGANNSNLYLGISGVEAIDGWIQDPGANNTAVGHRVWMLEPTQVRMGPGSIPSNTAPNPPKSAALYVIDPPNLFGAAQPTREASGFISWPPRGFVPNNKVYSRWSLQNNGADFSNAQVQVTVNGQPTTTTIEYRGPAAVNNSRPGPVITFIPTLPGFPSATDMVVGVTVTGVGGAGIPSTYSWTTTLIPPPTSAPVTTKAVADFSGDNKTDLSVFRPSTNTWFIKSSSGGPETAVGYGTGGDIPVPADYDGDAKADVAVYRPSNGTWFIRRSTGGETVQQYGASNDIPVPADYDGNDTTDLAVFRPSNSTWYLRGQSPDAVAYGTSGDVPVPGDYNGDGRTDVAVFRPSNGTWYLRNLVPDAVNYGASGDRPLPLAPAIRLAFLP
ncbi:MAG TPA: FG-GAP-like repeat-containing protein [Acidimicrobiales bacterium]|nr:FG-GAP-like repeat-containing protein [Acidimicrobiales bacterium]